jgi:hypothetical protein
MLLMDSGFQAQQILVSMENKHQWKGHPVNNSDVGYEWDYEDEQISSGTTGPYNPIETEVTKQDKEKKQ